MGHYSLDFGTVYLFPKMLFTDGGETSESSIMSRLSRRQLCNHLFQTRIKSKFIILISCLKFSSYIDVSNKISILE